MKFYDLEWLAEQCGTDNKYEITAKIALEARREAEEASMERNPGNERFISNVLSEIEAGKSPINAVKNTNAEPEALTDPKPETEAAEEAKAVEDPEPKPELQEIS